MIPATFEAAPSSRPPHRGPRRRLGPQAYGPRRAARPGEHFALRIWIPLVLVWILLAPFVILLLPFLIIGLAVMRLNPFRAIGTVLMILHSLGGTRIDVETPDALINIHLV